MIAKSAIRRYLQREFESFNWLKKLPVKEIWEEIDAIEPPPAFKTRPYKAQAVCFLLGTAFKNWNFHLDMGVGKAQPLKQRILTPRGWKRMGDIKPGDVLCHPDGGTTTVKAVYPKGIQPVYSVTFSDESKTVCCKSHLWNLESSRKSHRVMSLKRIMRKKLQPEKSRLPRIPVTQPITFDRFPYPRLTTLSEIADQTGIDIKLIQSYAEKLRWPATDDKSVYDLNQVSLFHEKTGRKILIDFGHIATFTVDPYTLGIFLGNKSLRRDSVWLATTDTELVAHVVKSLGESYNLEERDTGVHVITHPAGEASPLHRYVNHLGLVNMRGEFTHIPDCYRMASPELRAKFLQGIFDAGVESTQGGGFAHTSKSQRLALDVTFMLQSIGAGSTTVHYIVSGDDLYHVNASPSPHFPLVSLPRKLHYGASEKPYREFKSITAIGNERCQCIKVDRKDGLYLTDDFIVTHNTKLALDLFAWYKQQNKVDKALIIVPDAGNVEGWRDEINIHSNLSMTGLIGDKNQRFKALENDTDLYVINYHGLMPMMTKLKSNTPLDSTSSRTRRADVDMVESFVSHFDFVVYDEIHRAKNKDSLITHLCDLVAMNCEYRYGLTGTPMKSPEDLFSQFYVVDRGETLGDSFDLFQASFFNQIQGAFGAEWEFDERMRRQLTRTIQHRSIRYRDYECQDLPKKIDIPSPVVLLASAQSHYDRAMEGIIDADGNHQELKSAFVSLREITSGYLGVRDEETDEKIFIDFPSNPKMDMVLELVDAMPYDCKMIIYHEYIHTGELISQALKEAKINHRCLNGRTKDKPNVIRSFKEDETVHVLVSSSTGTTGHNFQVANYTVYYELFSSPITYQQSIKRTHRGRQKKPCYYYRLVARRSIDERIVDNLEKGLDLSTRILEGSTAKGFLY